ncbi:hypothetical protein BVG19_g3620 [[Candida] boidinii]|nr:hypothetical protein BVG19_g3620 [[Candida] boidinii]OWB52345.1 hypothetical protein B5S27_g3919 [[Candida] boidinii]
MSYGYNPSYEQGYGDPNGTPLVQQQQTQQQYGQYPQQPQQLQQQQQQPPQSYGGVASPDQLVQNLENLSLDQQHLQAQQAQQAPPTKSTASKKRRNLHAYHTDLMPAANGNDFINPSFDPNAAAVSAGAAPSNFSMNYQQSTQQPIQNQTQQYQQPINQTQQYQGYDSQPPQNQYQQQYQQNPNGLNSGMTTTTDVQNQIQTNGELSVSEARNFSEEEYKEKKFLTFQNACPPPAGTQYSVVDQGNASPKFIRMSMYNVPSTTQLREATKVPLGLFVRPFAPCDAEKGEQVPDADFREIGMVPRCRRCRTYVNPATQFQGYNMTCNMCHYTSPLPTDYVAPLDSNGVRTDYLQRAELHRGVVDFLVPKEYNLDELPSKPLNHVFLIDLTQASTSAQLPRIFASAIRLAIYDNFGDETSLPANAKISIIGFDKRLHFYDLSPSLMQTKVSIVGDLDDPFLPFYDGLFGDPTESYSVIESVLNTLEQPKSMSDTEPAFGAALNAAKVLLSEVGGGQVTAILSALPSWGPGVVKPKILSGKQIADYDKEVMTPENKFYQNLLKEYIKTNIGLNLFVASKTPVDLINTGLLAHQTGGILNTFPNFDPYVDEEALTHAIKDSVKKVTGYQGQLKIRCSSGLQVNKYYGGFQTSGEAADPVLPVLNNDTSIACDFVYDGKLETKYDGHFQIALLYTASDGQRKVRVINSIVSVTERVGDVFAFADQDTVLGLILRESISRLPTTNLVALKSYLNVQVADINTRYRKLVSSHGSLPGQLVFPHGLKTLAMFILSAEKTRALKEKTVNPDLRIESLYRLKTYPLDRLSLYLYPVLFNLLEFEAGDCETDQETGYFKLPKTYPLTRTSLARGGVHLIFNGEEAFLWLHTDVNPLLLQDLFGPNVESLAQVDPKNNFLPELDTEISVQLRNLCKYLSKHYNVSPNRSIPLKICRFSMDRTEYDFLELFAEDKSSDLSPSYPDYLRTLHKLISNKLENAAPALPKESSNLGNGESSTFAQRYLHF